jgi:multidrug efflux pump subunit AcrB
VKPTIYNLFYRQPRLTVLAIALVIVAGLSALNTLPRQEDPTFTERYARIDTRFPGASATRVEALVTEKIENELAEIEEIKIYKSTSRTGFSTILIDLDDSVYDVEEVWSRIRDKLVDAETLLPAAAEKPRFLRRRVAAFTFLAGFTWTLDDQPQLDVLQRLAKELEQRLAPMPGTTETKLFGEPEEEILVTIDPLLLASVDLIASDVSRAIARADAKIPAGQLHSASSDLVLELKGALDSADRIRRVTLREEEGGRFLRVGDVATVEKTLRRPPATIALIDGAEGVVVGAKMQANRRVDLWAAHARDEFKRFAATLPDGVHAQIIFDQSIYTEDRLGDLTLNLAFGAGIVVVVLFLMMGWKSALLVASGLPLTFCVVLATLKFIEVPLHQISIAGLIIALGILIDNAIVAINEYDNERRRGHGVSEAISETVRQLWVPLLASTITTALTFMPIVLMPGGAGEFVRTLGVTVVISIVASLFLSLTIIPALAGFVDRSAQPAPGFWRNGLSHAGTQRAYARMLDGVLKRPWTGVLAGVALPLCGFAMATQLTEQFFPPVDRAQFQIQVQLSPQASIAETRRNVAKADVLLRKHSEVIGSNWFLGQNPPRIYYSSVSRQEGVGSTATGFVDTTSAQATRALLPTLQRELSDAFPNAMVLATPFEQGPGLEAPVEALVYGPDLHTLERLGEELRKILAVSEAVTYTLAKITGGRPKLELSPNEDEARLAGFELVDLANQLNAALEGVTGGTVLEDTKELKVRVRISDSDRADLSRIAANALLPPQRLGVDARSVPGVPLSVLTRLELVPEINAITRTGGERVNTVQAFIKAFHLPGDTLADFQRRLAASDFKLPPGYRLEFGGESKESATARGSLFSLLVPLLVVMVGTVVLAFNSFRLAAIIGLVAIQSVGLSLLTLWLFGYPMGFMAVIGTMGLIGLAINDSIVVLSALNRDKKARSGDLLAIRTVVMDGTRHIISTTLTTAGGFVPLILFGGTFWPPLAIAIAGGLIGATVLALLFVPAVFTYVARGHGRRIALTGQDNQAQQALGETAL